MKKVLAYFFAFCTILLISNNVSITYANPIPDETAIKIVSVSILQPKTHEIYHTNNLILNISVNEIQVISSTRVHGYVWVGLDRNDSFACLTISPFNVSNSIHQINYSIPLTNIPNGNHSLTATVSYVQTPHLETNNPYIKNLALWGESNAINITVDAELPSNSSPTPTATSIQSSTVTATELPSITPTFIQLFLWVIVLLLSVFTVAVVLRHRKTANLKL